MPSIQARYWICTIPAEDFTPPPELPSGGKLSYLGGQRETGDSTGYEHWQLIAGFSSKVALATVRRELSRRGALK